MKNDLIGLIDADFLKYLVIYDIEKMYKGGLDPSVEIPYNTIIALIDKRVTKIFDSTSSRSKDYIFLFSGKTSDNYRSLISCEKKYKGNRKFKKTIEKDAEYRNIVEDYIKNTYNYCKYKDLEADDLCVMGHNEFTYIYSHDKDLRSSPGVHFDIKNNKFITIDKDEGFHSLMIQTLTGDSVDNIAGVEGVGKVGAEKILKNHNSNEDKIKLVISKYIKHYGFKDGLDRFTEMYSLVNLKTNRGDWTKEKYSEFFKQLNTIINKKDEDLEDLFS